MQPSQPTSPKKNIFTNKIFLIGIAVVLVAVLAIVFWPGGNSPQAATKKAFAAVVKVDAKTVLEFLPEEDVSWQLRYYDNDMEKVLEDLEEELFDINVEMSRQYGKNWNKKLKFTNEFSTKSQASVKVEFEDENSVSFMLKKEDGDWKIDNFVDF